MPTCAGAVKNIEALDELMYLPEEADCSLEN